MSLFVAGATDLGGLLREAALTFKTEVALIEASRRREVSRRSYLDVWREGARLARRLADLGIGPNDRVALWMTNQSAWLLTAYAVFYRGAVLVPVDSKLTADEAAAIVAHSGAKLLVAEHGLWRRGSSWPLPCVLSDAPQEEAGLLRWEDLPLTGTEPEPRTREDLATIVYSSGTGGRAKGCMLTHGAYLAQLEGLLELYPMVPGDLWFSILPTNHAIDFLCGFIGPFACGATVLHQRVLRPETLRATMERYSPTHMAVVPLLLTALEKSMRETLDGVAGWQRAVLDVAVGVNRRLTESGSRPSLSRKLLAPLHAPFGGRLQVMFCGGSFTPAHLVEAFDRFGLPVVIGYGLTEACTVVTVGRTTPVRSDTVGLPVRGVEVRIHEPGADGVGEVCVRGPTLMKGYLDDPELTGEVLRDGWLWTGDLGWFDASGHLHLCGRLKDLIVTAGGKNVWPEDVEGAFANSGCDDVAVFSENALSARRSMLDERLILVVRAEKGVDSVLGALVACNRLLPDYKRVDRLVRWSGTFPRTATMKLKRTELLAQLRASGALSGAEPMG